eukprot:s647_g27.t1
MLSWLGRSEQSEVNRIVNSNPEYDMHSKHVKAGFIVHNSESCFCAIVVGLHLGRRWLSACSSASRVANSGVCTVEAGARPAFDVHRNTKGSLFFNSFAIQKLDIHDANVTYDQRWNYRGSSQEGYHER